MDGVHGVTVLCHCGTELRDEAERKKVMSEVLQKVADEVGHGKGTLRKHYLLPNIEDDYVKKGKIPDIKQASVAIIASEVAEKFYMERIGKAVAYQELARQAKPAMQKLKGFVDETYEEVFGKPDDLPDEIQLTVKKMPPGKIGSYKYDGKQPHGLLSLDPRAFDKGPQMVCWVIVHELAHAAMGNTQDSDNHGPGFREFATALGIPERLQD